MIRQVGIKHLGKSRVKGGAGGQLASFRQPGFHQAIVNSYLGKGLEESGGQDRHAYVFGANLNAPNADNWAYPPIIVNPTAFFDLSNMTPNHEVVVALFNFTGLTSAVNVHIEWVREADNVKVYQFDYVIPSPQSKGYPSWSWYYFYSYIGYVPWEINQDGNYHVTMTTDIGLSSSQGFKITGVNQSAMGPIISNVRFNGYDKTVLAGGVCKANVVFDYGGPASTQTVRVAIGNIKTLLQVDTFDEIVYQEMQCSCPECRQLTTLYITVPVPITNAISPGIYDIYAKVAGIISSFVPDVINVGGGIPSTPVVTNVQVNTYATPVQIGGTCIVRASFDYVGPATRQTLDCAIGNNGAFGFDEILHQSIQFDIPKTDVKTTLYASITMNITSNIAPGTYSLYTRIMNVNSRIVDSAIVVQNIPPISGGAGSLTGKVTDAQGNPLSGVFVMLSANYTATTGADGSYSIQNIPPGSYPLVLSKAGYTPVNL